MKRLLILISLLICSCGLLYATDDCIFTGTEGYAEAFKKCNPSLGIKNTESPDLDIMKKDSDFSTMLVTIVRRVQLIGGVLGIGIIVSMGLILVLPFNAEGKESIKAKFLSVVLGFLIMISATIIINLVITTVYDIFS